jgi:hypothetical protein
MRPGGGPRGRRAVDRLCRRKQSGPPSVERDPEGREGTRVQFAASGRTTPNSVASISDFGRSHRSASVMADAAAAPNSVLKRRRLLHLFETSNTSLGGRLAGLGLALVCASGCSPTYQSVYDADVRFEHCYRVDEERNVALGEKLRCWRDWTQRSSYGQSRDRISYAQARERTLAQAIAAGLEAAPRGAAVEEKRAIPQPKSLYAPPPPTLAPASLETSKSTDALRLAGDTTSRDAGSPEMMPSLASSSNEPFTTSDAPGASCAGACAKTWSSCKQPCKAGACRTSCDDLYRGCMKACF